MLNKLAANHPQLLFLMLIFFGSTLACSILEGSLGTALTPTPTRTPLPSFTPTPTTEVIDPSQALEPPTVPPTQTITAEPDTPPESVSTADTATPTPTTSPSPTTTRPTTTATSTITPVPSPVQLEITEITPSPEECQLDRECIITVTGSGVSAEVRSNLQLYLLVSPLIEGQYQTYYVQAPVSFNNSDRWSSPEIYVGQAGDPPGQRFQICALVTEQSLMQGQAVEGLPQGQSVCEEVSKREAPAPTATSTPPPTAPPSTPTSIPSPTPTPILSFSCQSFRPPLEGNVGFNGAVEFQSPGDCAAGLDTTMTAGGNYSGDLNGKELWILVYPTDNEYYPQTRDACQMLPADAGGGVWNTIVNFGGPPQQYDLVAIVTNSDASETFKKWLKTGCETGDYPGYKRQELPGGIQEVGAITVSTKP